MKPKKPSLDIGTVSRLTGLTAANIRIWEKRYGVVEPERTSSGRRLYSEDDIRRLTLLKHLADHGQPIRLTAQLSDDDLERRLNQVRQVEMRGGGEGCRVAVIGSHLVTLLEGGKLTEDGLRIVAEFEDLEAAETGRMPEEVDLILMECPAFFAETAERVRRLVNETGALRAIVVYHYSQSRVIEKMEAPVSRITPIRAPVQLRELAVACRADVSVARKAEVQPVIEGDTEIAERTFDNREIATLMTIDSVVDCECPQHLARLLASLYGFEEYSKECENRNDEDAAMHAFLHQTTARARMMMEEAMRELMRFEGINLENTRGGKA